MFCPERLFAIRVQQFHYPVDFLAVFVAVAVFVYLARRACPVRRFLWEQVFHFDSEGITNILGFATCVAVQEGFHIVLFAN